ncbi:hypothetical protein [Bacillus mycoides]|uniref:hypothetical protein n=1 Tax=Bacillus mycoides TaxID=1405 RepID=UPI003A80CA01
MQEDRLKVADEKIKESEDTVKNIRDRHPALDESSKDLVMDGSRVTTDDGRFIAWMFASLLAVFCTILVVWVVVIAPDMKEEAIKNGEVKYVTVLEKNRNDINPGETIYEIRVEGKGETVQLRVDGHTYKDLKVGGKVAVTEHNGRMYVKE